MRRLGHAGDRWPGVCFDVGSLFGGGSSAALPVAAGVGAIGSVAGGLINSGAASSASSAQSAAALRSSELLDSAGTNANKYIDPYQTQGLSSYGSLTANAGTYGAIPTDYTSQASSLLGGATDAGYGAVGRINQLTGQTFSSPNATFSSPNTSFSSPNTSFSDPSSNFSYGAFTGAPTQAQIEATPGYAFNLQQGQEGVQNSAAARGLSSSGAALKGAATYASGLADSTYQNQYQDALSQYTTNEGAQQSIANQDFGNSLAANQASFGNSLSANQASFGNALQANQANFTNQQGQYTTNMTAGLQQAQGYDAASSALGLGAQGALGINTAAQGNVQNAFNRQDTLANFGLTAAQDEGTNLLASAGGQASYGVQGANATAAGQVGSANALSSGLTGLGNTATQYALYQQLLGGGGGNSSAPLLASADDGSGGAWI